MIVINSKEIEELQISSETCVKWIKEDFIFKSDCQLPAKISVHPSGNDFFTTMPCLLPEKYHRFGVKVVSRILGRKPALKSNMMLFDSKSGELLALIDSDWITTMRTGAVATLAIQTFKRKNAKNYSFIGLGNTAYATLLCLLNHYPTEKIEISLYKYKDQAESFIEKFKQFHNVKFTIISDKEEFIKNADVVVSCITDADNILFKNTNWFKKGVLVVPIHTRGFQNCDLVFDKIFGDDTSHIGGFKYFDKFHYFDEISNVLLAKKPGRENEDERIISYNIGLGLHDVYYASKIYDLINKSKQILEEGE